MSSQSSQDLNQFLKPLKLFLDGCRSDSEQSEGITHLSYGLKIIQGKFIIPNEKHAEFLELYTNAIKYHQLSILETPTEFNPLLIDFDLEGAELNKNGRLYDSIDITTLLNIYVNSLNQLFNISEYNFYIFEKPEPTKKKQIFVKTASIL